MKHLKTYGLALLTTFGVATANAQDLAMNTEKPNVSTFNKSSSNDNKVEPDVMIMKAAADHSKTGEIGVFVIAGNEFDKMTDAQLNAAFDQIMKRYNEKYGTNVGIELFIQRSDAYKTSTYDFYVDGAGVGETVTFKNMRPALQGAVNTHKRNRSLVYSNDMP